MNERYPDDAELLALEADEHTGVSYIRTGQSPYYLEFRRMLHRLLEATRRANDLRVYQDGDLSVGVRAGRCVIAGVAIAFEGVSEIAVANNAVTELWLAADGSVQSSTEGQPSDRSTFVPLASVETSAGAITSVTDRRGEAFLAAWNLAMLGVEASSDTLNGALAGAEATVTSTALNTLTAGPTSQADNYHQHAEFRVDANDMEQFTLSNGDSGAEANMALAFALPGRMFFPTRLFVDPSQGWLKQANGPTMRTLVGATSVSHAHAGELTATVTGTLAGVAPTDGEVVAVVLSAGANVATSQSTDHVEAVVKVNGVEVTDTRPRLRSADGGGFRSTDQGDGVAASIKTDGTAAVQRGDVITVDLLREVSGSVTDEAADVVVLMVIRASAPE